MITQTPGEARTKKARNARSGVWVVESSGDNGGWVPVSAAMRKNIAEDSLRWFRKAYAHFSWAKYRIRKYVRQP